MVQIVTTPTKATLPVKATGEMKITVTSDMMPQHKRIGIVAHNIQHEGGVTHATGNVQMRITPIPEGEDRTVIRADEVIYHMDTGEIETRGDARITIEKAQ
jgi:hypothetical protein